MGNVCCAGARPPPETPQDHKSAGEAIERESVGAVSDINVLPRTTLISRRGTVVMLPDQDESEGAFTPPEGAASPSNGSPFEPSV